MQPLHIGNMKPLKTYYTQEIETWLSNIPGRGCYVFRSMEVVRTAYRRAASNRGRFRKLIYKNWTLSL